MEFMTVYNVHCTSTSPLNQSKKTNPFFLLSQFVMMLCIRDKYKLSQIDCTDNIKRQDDV